MLLISSYVHVYWNQFQSPYDLVKAKTNKMKHAHNLTPTRTSKIKSEGKYNPSDGCASHFLCWRATYCSATISLCGKYRQSGTQSRALSHTLYIKLMWQNSGQEFSHSWGQLKLHPTTPGGGSLRFREAFKKNELPVSDNCQLIDYEK